MDYESIWNVIDVGDRLEAIDTIYVPQENGAQIRAFTAGKRYTVVLLLRPARSISVVDDSGKPHMIEGKYIQHFKFHSLA